MFKINAGIFAAGKGERLKSLFPNTPKPLVKILDKTLIDIVLENITILKPLNTVILLNNENFLKIKTHLKDKKDICFISFDSKTSFESFYTLASFLEDGINNLLLSTVDVIVEPSDLIKLVQFHIEKKSDITIGISEIPADEKPLVVDVNKDFKILSIGVKGSFATNGVYLFSPKIITRIKPQKYNALRYFLSSMDFKKLNIYSFYFPNSFDIDDETDLRKAENFFKSS